MKFTNKNKKIFLTIMFNRDRVINRKLTKVKLTKIKKVQLISFTITFSSVINRIEFIKVKLVRTRIFFLCLLASNCENK